jgi:hypothetical protein
MLESVNYGLKRQHNLSTLASSTNTYQTSIDPKSTKKYYDYSLNHTGKGAIDSRLDTKHRFGFFHRDAVAGTIPSNLS